MSLCAVFTAFGGKMFDVISHKSSRDPLWLHLCQTSHMILLQSYNTRLSRLSERFRLIVCCFFFMTGCFASQFASIWSFSLSSPSTFIPLNVFFLSFTRFSASSNVTSHLFNPSLDHRRLVFRELQLFLLSAGKPQQILWKRWRGTRQL